MRAFVTVGLPGCGKSTWARTQGLFEVNLDDCREAVCGDASNQAATPAAVFFRDTLLEYLGRRGVDLVVSDTNLVPEHREALIRRLRRLGYEVTLVYFSIHLATCLARNAARQRQVPEGAMAKMAQRLANHPVSPGEADHLVVVSSADQQQEVHS